ncbi:MAG: hypothetical protein ACRDHG_10710 [Anaerolineales bacterium]
MPTPVSTATTYCSAADFVKYIDVRMIRDLVRDDGTRANLADMLTEPVLTEALLAASGEVESACLVGNRYTPTDLLALTGASAAKLRRMVAWLAVDIIYERRGYVDRELPAGIEKAENGLERLRQGERIFGLQEQMDAGNSRTTFLDERDLEIFNGVAIQAAPFFGVRSNRDRTTR